MSHLKYERERPANPHSGPAQGQIDNMKQHRNNGTPQDAERLHRELDQQFDTALLRDGPGDDVSPIWDGPHQYLGGVAGATSPARAAPVGTNATTDLDEARRAWMVTTRRRAILRLIKRAPTLFRSDHSPLTSAWLAAAPPIVREYLNGHAALDIDDVALDLLRRAAGAVLSA